MADLSPSPDSNGDTDDNSAVEADRGSTTSTPRWVKVFGIIALVVVLLFVLLMFTRGAGGHGPRRHMPSGGGGGHATSSSVTESPGGFGGHDPSNRGH